MVMSTTQDQDVSHFNKSIIIDFIAGFNLNSYLMPFYFSHSADLCQHLYMQLVLGKLLTTHIHIPIKMTRKNRKRLHERTNLPDEEAAAHPMNDS